MGNGGQTAHVLATNQQTFSWLAKLAQKMNCTSKYYITYNLPERFEFPDRFKGYGCQKTPPDHPLYRTTTSVTYGYYPPDIHSVPKFYYPLSQKFTDSVSNFGMYRNYSLNM